MIPMDLHYRPQLSNMLATQPQIRMSYIAVLISVSIFITLIPFADIRFPKIDTFIPVYESLMMSLDLLTAMILYQQFAILRNVEMLVLSMAYVYSGAFTAIHMVSFPHAFGREFGLWEAPRASPWFYIAWHSGFPLIIVAYAAISASRDFEPAARTRHDGRAGSAAGPIWISLAVTLAFVAVCAAAIWRFQMSLPPLIDTGRFLPLMKILTALTCVLCIAPMLILPSIRPRMTLNLCIMLGISIWILDMVMTNVISSARFDLGWYAGKLFGLVSSCTIFVFYILESGQNHVRLIALTEALEALSFLDGLTNLRNRRYFDTYLAQEIAVARRHGRSIALVMCDVDNFKAFNDHHGHQAGDECLIMVAEALKSCCRRPSDVAARYGGEEFALILPETDLAGAMKVAEAIHLAVRGLGILHGNSRASPFVTVSIGVCVAGGPAFDHLSATSLIRVSDQALFDAKRQGRNQIVLQSV